MTTSRFLPPDTGYREPLVVLKQILYFIIGSAAAAICLELLWAL